MECSCWHLLSRSWPPAHLSLPTRRVGFNGFSTLIGIVSVLAAYAIAVAKYRLYDIDIVVSRTFVYGSLALFITAVYVAVVVGFGFLHGGDDLDIWLGIAATVVIALAFQPLRRATGEGGEPSRLRAPRHTV